MTWNIRSLPLHHESNRLAPFVNFCFEVAARLLGGASDGGLKVRSISSTPRRTNKIDGSRHTPLPSATSSVSKRDDGVPSRTPLDRANARVVES